ncbi:2-hydroxyacid dehydrogenase [Castellaniella ginsengisoli]|uniref:D-glycerate dehydrogenase n=1 Tax=Castellaniella ginsengisoli TaxID=546114 RepID=A0AB39DAE3_9BURK
MSRQTVLVYRDLPEPQLARILAEHEVIRADPRREDQREAFFDALGRVQGMIGSSFRLDAALLDRAPALKVVSSVSVGVDAYPLAALRERGIVLCHTPGVLTESVADLLFGMILATSRRLCDMADLVRQGRWVRNVGPEEYGWDVHGKTLGIVGYGRIGRSLARRAALGFDMPVVYHARRPVDSGLPPGKARAVGLDELLACADFVVLVLPLTEETRGLIGPEAFARMKPGAILINGARGPIVQERALLDALASGRLRGAGLDVFDVEPLPQDSPLRGHPRILALPHIGSATHETRAAMAALAVDNLLSVLRGETPPAAYKSA